MVSTKFTLIAVCVMSLSIFEVFAKKDFELTFLNFTCASPEIADKNSQTVIKAYHCGLSKNVKRHSLNFEITFVKNIPHFEVNVVVIMPRRSSDFVLLNLTKLNGCHLMANKHQVPLLQLGRKIIDQYSNFPKQCPMLANVLYYIRGFRVDMEFFPAFTIETDMHLKFEYIFEKNILFSGFIKSHVGLKGISKG